MPGFNNKYKSLVGVLFLLGVAARVALCWANPAENGFDDHFQPIAMMINSGHLPAKNACFQCYHPPVFYVISAILGKLTFTSGVNAAHVVKMLQGLNCFYGIMTLPVLYTILNKFPIPDFSKLLAFGTICFLPRHIYMSAIHSNDALSYLMVALSIYLMIIALENKLGLKWLSLLSLAITLSIFTKYTAFAVIPAVLVVFIIAYFKSSTTPRKKVLISMAITFLLPLTLLTAYMISNQINYKSPLPWNVQLYDPSTDRPKDKEAISFYSFKPWEVIETPLLVPGKLHSFWTLIYGGMWSDNEPVFQKYLDGNSQWWKRYDQWHLGNRSFPGNNPTASPLTVATESGLVALGLIPLFIGFGGIYFYLSGRWKQHMPAGDHHITLAMLPVLFLVNAAGIIAMTMRLPVYCSMKSSYFLISMPVFVVFLGIGLSRLEERGVRRGMAVTFGATFVIALVHITQLCAGIFRTVR